MGKEIYLFEFCHCFREGNMSADSSKIDGSFY